MLFVLYVNSLPDVVRSSQIAAFADDTKVFKKITSTRDAEQLQEDLSDLFFFSKRGGTSVHRLYHASVDSAVNRPDSKAESVSRGALQIISWIYHSFVTKQRHRLMNLNLLPISHWHEFLDMIFFFQSCNRKS